MTIQQELLFMYGNNLFDKLTFTDYRQKMRENGIKNRLDEIEFKRVCDLEMNYTKICYRLQNIIERHYKNGRELIVKRNQEITESYNSYKGRFQK